jgi:hypothetical protein
VQHRQKTPYRGTLHVLQRATSVANWRLRLSLRPLLISQLHPGVAEVETLHAYLAESLSRLTEAFGGVLKTRCGEATMYEDLKKVPLDVKGLSSAILGG